MVGVALGYVMVSYGRNGFDYVTVGMALDYVMVGMALIMLW